MARTRIPELSRPDPERLLKQVQAEENKRWGARLKIFLGYSTGVGKSYRMLDEARRRHERGEDVVVGAVQDRQPEDVQVLLSKLESVPLLPAPEGQSLDMDAILRRHPQICVIDPLAARNPAGSRNAHRWEDVQELLRDGISVLTSVNLLHVEEYREKVQAITGKETSETIPKSFLLTADDIVIVDVPTDLCLSRLGEKLTATGISNTQERKLSELRELTLLLTAEVVDAQLESYVQTHGIEPVFGTQERFLVCITPSSNSLSMIESGRRNKERFQGELYVIYVRDPAASAEDVTKIDAYLDTAREAGAVPEVLESDNPISAIVEFAYQKRITQIFVAHSRKRFSKLFLRGNLAASIERRANDLQVTVVADRTRRQAF